MRLKSSSNSSNLLIRNLLSMFGICHSIIRKVLLMQDCGTGKTAFYLTKLSYYRKWLRTRARAAVPSIISTGATLITVDMILTALQLSSLFTQITESGRPASARTMLQISPIMRTPSGKVIFRNTGTRAASGSRLIICAARLSF